MVHRETLREGTGKQLEKSGRVLHRDVQQLEKASLPFGAVQMDKTNELSCNKAQYGLLWIYLDWGATWQYRNTTPLLSADAGSKCSCVISEVFLTWHLT